MSALPPKADILASPRASIYLHWLSGQIALFEFGRKHVLIGHANCAAKRASGHAPIRAMSARPNARSLDLCQRTTQRLRCGCHRYPTPSVTAAREQARELRKQIDQGIDPAGNKRERREAATH